MGISTRVSVFAFRCAWDRADNKFDDATVTIVEQGNASRSTCWTKIESCSDDVATEALSQFGVVLTTPDLQQQDWSNARFPA